MIKSLRNIFSKPSSGAAKRSKAELAAAMAELEAENAKLRFRLAESEVENLRLRKENDDLKAKITLNSGNSSNPPSSDGLRKKPVPSSLRKRTGRKSGGQMNHLGHNLNPKKVPDHIVDHKPKFCTCGCDLREVPMEQTAARQVLDLPPPPPLDATEHRVYGGVCPKCGTKVAGQFPAGVDGPVQYGPRLSALLIFLHGEQYIPLERLTATMSAMFNVSLGEGTIVNKMRKFAGLVKEPVERIFELLAEGELVHLDETGMRASGSLHWLHVASTRWLTYYHLHSKRGTDAFEGIGLIPLFKGKAVHDFWKSYFDYGDIIHCLCVAHLLRELKLAHEHYSQKWAERMIELLVEAHDACKEARQAGMKNLAAAVLAKFKASYKAIVAAGKQENNIRGGTIAVGKRGAPQTKPVNLLARFDIYDDAIFRFAEDLTVPFDNNQAERDIRMAKLRQKTSGTFRSKENGKDFFMTRSYISTVKKQTGEIIDAIQSAFEGKPFMPEMAPANSI